MDTTVLSYFPMGIDCVVVNTCALSTWQVASQIVKHTYFAIVTVECDIDPNVLDQCQEYMDANRHVQAIAPCGSRYLGQPTHMCKPIRAIETHDVPVDRLDTAFLFARASIFELLPMRWPRQRHVADVLADYLTYKMVPRCLCAIDFRPDPRSFCAHMIVFSADALRARNFELCQAREPAVRRFEAVDGRQREWCASLNRHFHINCEGFDRGRTHGKVGCNLSHGCLWHLLAHEVQHNWYLILEDDVELTAEYTAAVIEESIVAAEEANSHFVRLEPPRPKYCRAQSRAPQRAQHVFDMVPQSGMAAYLLDRAAASVLIARPFATPVDQIWTASCIEQLRPIYRCTGAFLMKGTAHAGAHSVMGSLTIASIEDMRVVPAIKSS